jgi:uncharacterized protein
MAARGHPLKRLGVRLALGAAGLVLAGALVVPPALAQFGGPSRRGGVFDSFFGPRFGPPEPRADFSRAPPPRRMDTPPATTVLVLGDSMADWLAHGLEEALADVPEFGVVRRHRTGSGLIRYDSRSDTQDWVQVAREAITATKPKFVVMMVGLNDRQAIRARPSSSTAGAPAATAPAAAPAETPSTPPPAASQEPEADRPEQPTIIAPEPPGRAGLHTYEFRSEQWTEHYIKRIDATMAALKASGVPVLWVGLPAIRGPKSTSDMQYLDELFRTRAEKAGVTYIDVWDGFVEDGGRFANQGPDFEGQIRRLRAGDGVHFTKAGARKLAHYVERELRRSMTRDVTPVALPSSEPAQQTPAARPGQPTARPLSGPVLPLTAAAAGQQDLAGGGAPGAAPIGQAVATRVLQKGEATTAPAGRSDDFTWPRRSVAPFGTDPAVATTTDPLPVMQAAPAATTVPVPSDEVRAAAGARRPAARPPSQQQQAQQQQQQRRNTSGFSLPFFR